MRNFRSSEVRFIDLGGGRTRRFHTGTGADIGGNSVPGTAHGVAKTGRGRLCQKLSPGGSCRKWCRGSS